MTDRELEACLNVLRGLTAGGDNRVEEAIKLARDLAAAGDRAPLEALPDLQRQVEDGPTCDCSECHSWDGTSRRCSCGNRRVYWLWDQGHWRPEVY